ncbi:MAG: toprim domain-containing protein [Thiohalocapsa sp.]
MSGPAAELACRLARDAEAVCRHYLSRGRRNGRYWIVGDAMNTPGRSLYVRLDGPDSGPGAAGKFTDAATGEHGDLLDLIARNRNLSRLSDILDEARNFLSLPRQVNNAADHRAVAERRSSGDSSAGSLAARRLFRAGRKVTGTLAEAYLRARGITGIVDWPSLRFHPRVYYRAHADASREAWPALLAAVTDHDGNITGVQRTWLDPVHRTKAPLAEPRRALGHLLGNGVRFGASDQPALAEAGVLAAGEGIETMLALKSVLPELPMIAALSANHLAALEFPAALRRLYVARDNDAAGLLAAAQLHDRGTLAGIEVRDLVPMYGDFNIDLWRLGATALLHTVADQLLPPDRVRFIVRVADRGDPGDA